MRRTIILLPFVLAACGSPQMTGNDSTTVESEAAATPQADLAAGDAAMPAPSATPTHTAVPSYDCGKARTAVETMICSDDRLAALDREMAADYLEERGDMDAPLPVPLKAKQRAFLQARNACSTADCIADAYEKRASGGFDMSLSGEQSCSAEIGMSAAKTLVEQCIAISPATHPPCNVANSCAMIRGEVTRSCALFDADDPTRPAYCDDDR